MADCDERIPRLVWMGVVVPRGKGEKVVKKAAAAGSAPSICWPSRGEPPTTAMAAVSVGAKRTRRFFSARCQALSGKILAVMAEKWSRPAQAWPLPCR